MKRVSRTFLAYAAMMIITTTIHMRPKNKLIRPKSNAFWMYSWSSVNFPTRAKMKEAKPHMKQQKMPTMLRAKMHPQGGGLLSIRIWSSVCAFCSNWLPRCWIGWVESGKTPGWKFKVIIYRAGSEYGGGAIGFGFEGVAWSIRRIRDDRKFVICK